MGKSGIWRYIKYADGTAECSGTKEHTITKTGNYWLPDVNLPFTMVKPANSYDDFTVAITSSSYIAPTLYTNLQKNKTSISTVGCAVNNAVEKGTVAVCYFVRGRWK